MKDIILKQITKGVSLNELANITGHSEKKVGYVIHMLRNDGYDIRQTFDSKGNIYYHLGLDFTKDVITIENDTNELRALIISDIHIGRTNDGIDNLYKAMEYAKNNNIHIIFNLGDLFEGLSSLNDKNNLIMEQQIDRFFKNYPYNQNMIHFTLLGNHDYSMYRLLGFDLSKKIISRPDIISLGYGKNFIKIGNSLIGFRHDLVDTTAPLDIPHDSAFIFRGHSHKFEYNETYTYVPALLNSPFYQDLLSCGFLDVNFMLDDKANIDTLVIKYLAMLDAPREVSEIYVSPKVKKKI